MYKHKNGVTLRKLAEADLPLLLRLKEESWFGTHHISFINAQDQDEWFHRITRSRDDLMLIAEDDKLTHDKRVGLYKISSIDWINRTYVSGHDVFCQARGKGYGHTVLEAGVDFGFEILNMNRIDTEVLENNLASLKTALNAGYQKEGIRRRAVYKCGQYLDSITLGITREDWLELERVKKYAGVCNSTYTPKNDVPRGRPSPAESR